MISNLTGLGDNVTEVTVGGEVVLPPKEITVIDGFEDGSDGWVSRWMRDTGSFTSTTSPLIHADSNRSLATGYNEAHQ